MTLRILLKMIAVLVALAVCLTATPVAALAEFTNPNYAMTIGRPFTITWTGATTGVTLKLNNGPVNDQSLVLTIASKLKCSTLQFI